MSLRLLLRNSPSRSLALVTDTQALVFSQSQPNSGADPIDIGPSSIPASTCRAEFTSVGDVDLADYRASHLAAIHGTLGLVNIDSEVFLCIITGAARVAVVRPNETVQQILSVEFCKHMSL